MVSIASSNGGSKRTIISSKAFEASMKGLLMQYHRFSQRQKGLNACPASRWKTNIAGKLQVCLFL
jgi:hypothetical protein